MRQGFILDVMTVPAYHSDTGAPVTTLFQVETQTETGRRFGFIVDTELPLGVGEDAQWDKHHLYVNLRSFHDAPIWAELTTLEGPVRVCH